MASSRSVGGNHSAPVFLVSTVPPSRGANKRRLTLNNNPLKRSDEVACGEFPGFLPAAPLGRACSLRGRKLAHLPVRKMTNARLRDEISPPCDLCLTAPPVAHEESR